MSTSATIPDPAAVVAADGTATPNVPDQVGESRPPTGGKPVAPVMIAWKAKATAVPGTLDIEFRLTTLSSLQRMLVSLRGQDGLEILDALPSSAFDQVGANETRTIAGRVRLVGQVGTVIVEISASANDLRGRSLGITLTRDGSKPPAAVDKAAGPTVTGDDGEKLILQPADRR